LNDRELGLRAEDLARAIVADGAGQPRLDLPPKLAAAYAAAPEDDLFVIRDTNGRVIAASPAEFGERVSKWPPATDEPSYFRLSGAGSEDFGSETYYGLSIALQTAAGPMWISVARTEGSNALIRSLLREFVLHAIWVSPLLMLATLAIGTIHHRAVGEVRNPVQAGEPRDQRPPAHIDEDAFGIEHHTVHCHFLRPDKPAMAFVNSAAFQRLQ
jgi:hypothetical protein